MEIWYICIAVLVWVVFIYVAYRMDWFLDGDNVEEHVLNALMLFVSAMVSTVWFIAVPIVAVGLGLILLSKLLTAAQDRRKDSRRRERVRY